MMNQKNPNLPKKVFAAEDNKVSAKVIDFWLRSMGMESKVVFDGQAMIDLLKHETCDLILMDLSMPIMDGYEASRRIRSGEAGEQNMKIPIVAFTALARTVAEAICADAEMNGFVNKPIKKATMLEAMEIAMNGYKMHPNPTVEAIEQHLIAFSEASRQAGEP